MAKVARVGCWAWLAFPMTAIWGLLDQSFTLLFQPSGRLLSHFPECLHLVPSCSPGLTPLTSHGDRRNDGALVCSILNCGCVGRLPRSFLGDVRWVSSDDEATSFPCRCSTLAR
jgi:hypothetical protein